MVLLGLLLPTLAVGITLSAWLIFIAIRPFKTGKVDNPVILKLGHSAKPHRNETDCNLDVEKGNGLSQYDCSSRFVPRALTWHGVEYSVKLKGGPEKKILQQCYGRVLPGEMLAIVGPSGAGKSTLLDLLAMRIQRTAGEVMVDGVPQDRTFSQMSTYVPQEDAFVPTLSVWETLLFYCCLRLPTQMGQEERNEVMEASLASMGLSKVTHSQVGGSLPGGLVVRGLSGGERRRLHIACGVVAAPSIIFLDEPTSGLDSHAALVLMKHMRGLAGKQRTLVCSIHQPRQAIWDMFDKLEVLSEGFLLYFGRTSEAVQWFQCLGFQYAEAQGAVSDWLLDLVSVGFHDSIGSEGLGLSSLEDVEAAAQRYSVTVLPSNMGTAGKTSCEDDDEESEAGIPGPSTSLSSYPTPWLNQAKLLFWRTMLSLSRNPADMLGRLLLSIWVGLILGWVLTRRSGKVAALDVLTVTFFVCQTIQLLPFAYMSLYVADRRFYMLDVASNLYHPSAYHVAQTLAAIPSTLVNGVVLYYLVYAIIGLRGTISAIVLTGVFAAFHSVVSIQVVALAAYLTPNQDLAFVAGIAYGLLGTLVAGFLVKPSDMQPVLWGISYVTPFRYVFQLLLNIQFENTPEESLMRYMGINTNFGLNVGVLVIIYGMLQLLTYLALHFLHRPRTLKF